MNMDYLKEYQKITKGYAPPVVYTTPEEQGSSIKKCNILEVANIEYSNETTLKTASTDKGVIEQK